MMPITIQLANHVRRLCRQDLTVRQIANRLGRPETAIMKVLGMMGIPLPGEVVDPSPLPSEEDRAAMRAKMPKKWQDRTNKQET